MASEKEYLVKEELHKGAFDDEPASFEIMDRYCMEHGLSLIHISEPTRP